MTYILNLLWHTCHIIHRFIFLKKYISICTDFFYSKCRVSHKNISHISLTCKSSWSNFLQQPASKSSFDHIQEVHVQVLSIRPRCKKNKSKFHFIYGKKTICCLDQHLKVDEIKDIYILYIDGKKIPVVKCNLIESAAMPAEKKLSKHFISNFL